MSATASRWARYSFAALLLGACLIAPAPASARGGPCSSAEPSPGGDWPMYGHDKANTRTQPSETTLPPQRVGGLRPAWSYDTGNRSKVVTYVDLDSTPAVARGCVFIADGGGDIAALDADDGRLIWRRHVEAGATGIDSGTFIGSPFVDGSRIILVVNRSGGPYALALDAGTGAIRWQSPPVDANPGSYSHASPMVHHGVVFVGYSALEGDPKGQGGFALVSARNGAILAHTPTVAEPDQATGYAGGGIWSTPAIDPVTGYAFFGSGNPFSKQVESERTNAILKADLDRRRPTFGHIVGSYKGTIDQSIQLLQRLAKPTCSLFPENPPALVPLPEFVPDLNQARDSYACLQLDLDFGGSANLIRAGNGRMLIGELQKSGVYHVIDAENMKRVRTLTLGVSCLLCNGASTAYDATMGTVFGAVSPGALMVSFPPAHGGLRWLSPIADGIHYQPPAVADGVVYTLDSSGFLDAFHARTGAPLVRRQLALDGAPDAIGALASGGIAVANHTVYVAAGSHLLAYRPSAARAGRGVAR